MSSFLKPVRAYEDTLKKTGLNSVFATGIANTLGLEHRGQEHKLMLLASTNPAQYSQDRQTAYEMVVKSMVEQAYSDLWLLLSEGKMSNGSGDKVDVLKMNGLAESVYAPKIPDQEISQIATDFARYIVQAYDDVFERVLPTRFTSLANDKLARVPMSELARAPIGNGPVIGGNEPALP